MRILLLLLGFGFSMAARAAEPTELRVCFEDKQVFPLYNKPGLEESKYPGVLIEFARHMAQKYGVKLTLMRRPPTACRVLMKAGTVDAYGIVSFLPGRDDWAVYPRLPSGEVDSKLVFKQAGYYLYGREDKPLPWDGKNLNGLKGLRIGSSEGYSINEELKKAGATVESFKSVDAILKRLIEKQLDGAALHSNRIDTKIKTGVKKYEIPLKLNDYYFTFSKAFFGAHKEFCEKFWKDSVHFEQSPDGRKIAAHYEALEEFPAK